VRYDTALSDRAREVAILVVSVHWDSDFEWYAHEAVGRHAGLTADELRALRDCDYSRFPVGEAAVALTDDALVTHGDLSDAAYDQAVAAIGRAGVFELSTLVGYYATLALQLRVFRVPLPSPTPAKSPFHRDETGDLP